MIGSQVVSVSLFVAMAMRWPRATSVAAVALISTHVLWQPPDSGPSLALLAMPEVQAELRQEHPEPVPPAPLASDMVLAQVAEPETPTRQDQLEPLPPAPLMVNAIVNVQTLAMAAVSLPPAAIGAQRETGRPDNAIAMYILDADTARRTLPGADSMPTSTSQWKRKPGTQPPARAGGILRVSAPALSEQITFKYEAPTSETARMGAVASESMRSGHALSVAGNPAAPEGDLDNKTDRPTVNVSR